MNNTSLRVPTPVNETVLSYAPGTSERAAAKHAVAQLMGQRRELPNIIAGATQAGAKGTLDVRPPHRHHEVVGVLHSASGQQVEQAIHAAMGARAEWMALPMEQRFGIFLRAADLVAGRHRALINAATMVGQSKTVHQAEIDSACELADFLRFNVHFAQQIYADQPLSGAGMWNRMDYRPLDGFVLAITPFNFTAIGGNLPTAPAIMGNTVVWKPASTAALSNQIFMEILMEAGLPAGVINLVHAPGAVLGDVALKHPDLAGIHFTGSTGTFQHLWRTVGENLPLFRCYPRLVGETGGKDFVFAHASADADALAVALVRGAFEYQGQKCSAASRAYIPKSLWSDVSERLEAEIGALKVGDVADFDNFMGAVIDRKSFENIKNYIAVARASSTAKVWLGGECDDRVGYFVQPTVVVVTDPKHVLMQEEIFGPVLTIYVYEDDAFEETMALCDSTSPYALTGAVFAQDRSVIARAMQALRFSAGNFYINDKPTGAVVGQQPFGGGRQSGTNDKAGSLLNLTRWTSARSIKETLDPPRSVAYPFMAAE